MVFDIIRLMIFKENSKIDIIIKKIFPQYLVISLVGIIICLIREFTTSSPTVSHIISYSFAIIYLIILLIGTIFLIKLPKKHKINKIFSKIISIGLIIYLTIILISLACRLIE